MRYRLTIEFEAKNDRQADRRAADVVEHADQVLGHIRTSLWDIDHDELLAEPALRPGNLPPVK